VSSSISLVISLSLCILIFGGMQMFKSNIASTEWKTVAGGFVGSWFFVFSLTVSFLLLLFDRVFSDIAYGSCLLM